MTVKECYEKLEGDYSGTMSRMMKEDRMKKFLLLFLQDTSYQMLCENMDKGDVDEAFRAAHTLKGVTINLGLSKLNRASFEIISASASSPPEAPPSRTTSPTPIPTKTPPARAAPIG